MARDDELCFDTRIRVVSPLAAFSWCNERVFMWCELRPEPCAIHGYRHSGDLHTIGHHPEEAGVTGAISAVLGGENGGHMWVVRYDRLLEIRWADGQVLRVNSGTYTAGELEVL